MNSLVAAGIGEWYSVASVIGARGSIMAGDAED